MDAVSDAANEQVVMMLASQVGKALALDTPLPTPTGWTTMGDVSPGDHLLDETGSPCRVTAVSPVQEGRICYNVRFSDDSEIVADADHRWYVEPSSGVHGRKAGIKTTTEIAADLHLVNPKTGSGRNIWSVPVADPLDLPPADLPLPPYALGAWLGDGNSAAACITVGDEDFAEMAALLRAEGIEVAERKGAGCGYLLFNPRGDRGHCRGYATKAEYGRAYYRNRRYGDAMTEMPETGHATLARLGVLKNKHIPAVYLRASIEQRMALLQGLLDTDGYAGARGTIEYVATNRALADGFFELAASLGFKPMLKEAVAKLYGREIGQKFRVTFTAYADRPVFRLKRKLARLKPLGPTCRPTETRRRFIVAVDPVSSVPVKCAAVDSLSHLFLAGRAMVPTHNTEVILNTLGYYIDQEPSPILIVVPRVDDAKSFSKDRIAPMLRDTPALRGKVADARSRDSMNTVLSKHFPGGHLTLGGANSPAGLAMRPIRLVLADEVDRFPASAGTEGDPLSLAIKRTSTFWNRKIIIVSTPTIAGTSRIDAAFAETDQRRYFVPCPHCGHAQPLWWSGVRWDKDENGRHLPETAAYCCEDCGALWGDGERWAAVQGGEWRATAESMTGKVGFHLNGLYSPWKRLAEYVAEWLEAQGNTERLKAFVNTVLAETYREKGDAPDWQRLYDRREDWPGNKLPAGALLLTAGVDVQRDRIEARVWAWGRGRQSWLADTHIIQGDTSRAEPWAALSDLLERSYPHVSGADMKIARMAIDSGYATAEVYRWARRYVGRVLVVKGAPDGFRQPLGVPSATEVAGSKRSRSGIKVWPVGGGYLKEQFYGWLRLDAPVDGQPYPDGYVHLPRWAGDDEIKQLTAEELVTERTRGGFARQVWRKVRERNEALDCRVYAYAAAAQMGMERFSEERWSQFGMTLGETVPAPAAAPVPAPSVAAAVAPPAAQPARRAPVHNPYTSHLRGGRY